MNTVYTGQKDDRLFNKTINETMLDIMASDGDVLWLDADLMGCSGTKGQLNRDVRFINCGIAEANMVGIAAGLSAVGFKPYCHTFGPFASRRCFDQAFLSAGYAHNPVTIIGTDPGITAAFNGGTHMPFEDMALYRALPESTVVDVTDVPMLKSILRQARELPGVKYIRVPRKESFQVFPDDYQFRIGKGNVLREGKDALVVASGIMVREALDAAQLLEKDGIEITVIDPYTVKPLDKELIVNYAKKLGTVVTAENHNRIGGLTSAVQDAIVGIKCRFGCVAVEDEFGEVGPQDYLRSRYDLTKEHIIRLVKELRNNTAD